MLRFTIVLAAFALALAAVPTDMPEPGELAFVLNEEDFEDYLDAWLAREQENGVNITSSDNDQRSGCTIRVNGDLGQPQPVYITNGRYMQPNGNTGQIRLNSGQQVIIACTGSNRAIRHPNVASNIAVGCLNAYLGLCQLQVPVGWQPNRVVWSGNPAEGKFTGWESNLVGQTNRVVWQPLYSVDCDYTTPVHCANNNLVHSWWLRGNSAFGQLTCSGHSYHNAEGTSQRCWNNNLVVRVGFIVHNMFHPLYFSCFDQRRLEVLFVWYEQNPENRWHQTGVDRPSWLAGPFFPGVPINNVYTQVSQRAAIAGIVGQQLADRYITSTQFLARGHLAAKSDFVFATGQRASFYFINAAPQWQPFNAGNWNWLEQNLRARIGTANFRTTVYTGTFGVTQLRNQQNRLVDIFLHNRNQVPVPLYFYKVAYDAGRRLGTAFVSINNPYYTLAEVRQLQFCTDRCRNNNAFNWLRWQPDRIDLGFSFCCDINEFRRRIPHLPAFTVNGLLT